MLSEQEPRSYDVMQPWKIGTEFLTISHSSISAGFITHMLSQHALLAEEEFCPGYFR
jgi:hypothetical protein